MYLQIEKYFVQIFLFCNLKKICHYLVPRFTQLRVPEVKDEFEFGVFPETHGKSKVGHIKNPQVLEIPPVINILIKHENSQNFKSAICLIYILTIKFGLKLHHK